MSYKIVSKEESSVVDFVKNYIIIKRWESNNLTLCFSGRESYTNFQNKNILFMKDVGEKVKNLLIQEYNWPKMDILKVGHHGSKNSSSK